MSKESAMNLINPGNPVAPPAPPSEPVAPVETPAILAVDSDRFAKIAAREAKLVKEREAFKSEQQKIYEEKEKLKAVKDQIDEFESLKSKDPIAALKKLGFSEEDIFNYMASKEELTPEQKAAEAAAKAADEKIKTWEQQQAERESKALKERDDKAISAFRSNIGKSIEKEADKYEYCAFKGPEAEATVFETVLEIIKQEPDILPHKALQEALDLVEKFYEDEDKQMGTIKKRQPKVEAAPEPETSKQQQRTRTPQAPVAPPPKPAPTLTNRANATVSSTISRKESPSEKRERLKQWLATGVRS